MSEIEKNNTEFDHSGQYESGLKSLVRSLRLAFFFLLVLIIGMLIYFFTLGGYIEVKPQEAVVVLRFGAVKEDGVLTRGWHWYIPYPVTKFVVVRTSPQTLMVDFSAQANQIGGGNAQQALEPGRDGYLLSGDANIIHSTWRILYQISDPKRYYERLTTPEDPRDLDIIETADGYTGSRGPQTMLTNFFRQAVVETTATLEVDGMLYDQKTDYLEKVQRLFRKLVHDADCGIEIASVSLDMVTPPAKTKAAFDEVAAANTTMDALKQSAREYEVKTLNAAEADSVAVLSSAETYRKQMVAEVKAGSLYFESINKAYLESPETVLMSLYNYTLADVLEAQDGKFILGTMTGDNRKQIRLKINPEPPRKAAADQPEEN